MSARKVWVVELYTGQSGMEEWEIYGAYTRHVEAIGFKGVFDPKFSRVVRYIPATKKPAKKGKR